MSFGRIFYGILSHVTIHVLGVFCRKQTVLNILVSRVSKKKLEVGKGAFEEWASSADQSHSPSALCRNRENRKVRKQLRD